jgi:protein-L-isoaspartate(D-aspartate) O-methyltransferase
MTLASYRRFYAEEVETVSALRTPALVEALATVPRERFLGPGPWLIKAADGDLSGAPRPTVDDDPRRVYHNVPIAIDPGRQLFNGQPGTIAAWIDRLAPAAGTRALHVGAGTGYYTSLMAHCAGETGRVVAYEADEGLAARARENLRDQPQVEVRQGDATAIGETFDAILVNAGATHPLDAWLAALAPGGRLVLPMTFSFGGAPITKGIVALITRRGDTSEFDASLIGFVAIFAAVGVRDESLNARIGAALQKNPMPKLARLRRDAHEAAPECWLHDERFCLESAPAVQRTA